MAKQLRVVVVGASTLQGKELVEEINASPAAVWNVRLVDEESTGEAQLAAAGDEAVLVHPLQADSFDNADLVFFAGTPAVTRAHSQQVIFRGASIVDLTDALEDQPGMLLRSPWLGEGPRPDLTTTGIVNPQAAALVLALVAQRLERHLGLDRLTATILEPASQQGRAGVDELHQQTVSLLSFQSLPQEIYGTQVAFNVQDTLEGAAEAHLGDTRKRIHRHLDALLGPARAQRVRFEVLQAPVFHAYTISCYADLRRAATSEEIMSALNGGVIVSDTDTKPSNLAATEVSDLLISVTTNEGAADPGAWLWMAADNLRFAARSAIAAAMDLAALRPTPTVQ